VTHSVAAANWHGQTAIAVAATAAAAGLDPVDVLLLMAASENDTPKVEELLAAGANINIADNKGKSPLDLATKQEVKDLIEVRPVLHVLLHGIAWPVLQLLHSSSLQIGLENRKCLWYVPLCPCGAASSSTPMSLCIGSPCLTNLPCSCPLLLLLLLCRLLPRRLSALDGLIVLLCGSKEELAIAQSPL
jgi:hypothetical protein